MLKILREYKDGHVEYHFIGSMEGSDLELLKKMMKEDMNRTYRFTFNFRETTHIDANTVKILKEVYVMSVEYACEINLTGLHAQPAIMLEIFQADKLYNIMEPVNNVYGGENEPLYYA
ncbi:hypothetical protein ACM66Z_00255 [Sulfurovum sp. ST-21]|uniref:STAS domain-containing protein n=1 Tax=Sulfurovum indicum TaxID=2779528 RepID=A0A7M1S6H3_9BACT|nr:hypothetical protein [Sulfurovum indicum]QOR61960.1 hypothetical protein IMZ28_00255 [Sulfurovum indicum]